MRNTANLLTCTKPSYDPAAPLETTLRGDAASTDSPLFGGETLIDARRAAAELGITKDALDGMIDAGVGPPYFSFGEAKRMRRFLPSIVRAWAGSRVEVTIAPVS